MSYFIPSGRAWKFSKSLFRINDNTKVAFNNKKCLDTLDFNFFADILGENWWNDSFQQEQNGFQNDHWNGQNTET